MWYITRISPNPKHLDCPPTHKLWFLVTLERDNLTLTDVCPQTGLTQTRTSQAPINIEERPAVQQTVFALIQTEDTSASTDRQTYGRTDRPTAIYFLLTFKLQQYVKKTLSWFKSHTCATVLVNSSPNETLCFCLVHMSLPLFSLFPLYSCPYV